MNRTAFLGVLLMLIASVSVVDAGALPEGEIELVVDFDGAAGEFPEGVAVDKKGNVFVSMSHLGEVWRFPPRGDASVVCHIDLDNSFFNFGVVGLAVDAQGNVYAAVASLDPATQGIYRIGRRGEGCERIAGTEDLGFADGLAFTDGLAFDKRENLYVTEADEGAIYRIDRRGNIELWLQHPLLEGTGSSYGFVRIGANGIQYWKRSLIVANSEKYLIVRVPIRPNGSAGEPEVLYDAFDPASGFFEFFPDGIALDVFGNVYVADPVLSQIVFVAADGTLAVPLTTAETILDNPTSLAFGTGKGDRKNVFIANFDLLTPEVEAAYGVPVNYDGPSLAKVGTGRPGNPLP